jgi:predicted nucleic acid-binding protein
MNVLIDSSGWVDFLNGNATTAAAGVESLLRGDTGDQVVTCGVVVAEVLQGLRRPGEFSRVRSLFEELELHEARGLGSYVRAADLFRKLRERGVTVRSTIDCLIAVLAEESGGLLLARDRDLERIVASGLVDVRLWPG